MEKNLEKIVALLKENLYYPRRARKRGVEGEVLVSFRLLKNAEVCDIKVLNSPSDILSRGAIRTLEELSSKFPKPEQELNLKVPIYYKLH
jgi:protein TonB